MMRISHPMRCRRRAASSMHGREYDCSCSDPYKRSICGSWSVGLSSQAGPTDRQALNIP